MIIPIEHNKKEETKLVISNIIHDFLHPFKPESELRSFLESFGLYKGIKPNVQGAADFIKDVQSNRYTNNPEFLQERGRIREMTFKGRATPQIGRAK